MTWNMEDELTFDKQMLADYKNQRFFFQTYPMAGACKQILSSENFKVPGEKSLHVYHTSHQFTFNEYSINVAFMGDISKFTPMSTRRFSKVSIDKDFMRIDVTPLKEKLKIEINRLILISYTV